MSENVMMLGREVKRVALDFDAPLNKVWEPRTRTPSKEWPVCMTCGGDGATPAGRQLERTWYAFEVADDAARELLCWHNKLTQDEVDHLIEKGRLPTWVPALVGPGGHWEKRPRKAEDVNAANTPGQASGPQMLTLGHEAINRWICIRYRAEKLGIEIECADCGGYGNLATGPEREQAKAWEPPEPPAGPGWQMWETITEGSPISPVCESEDELAHYMASIDRRFDRAGWMRVIRGEANAFALESGELL